MTMSKTMLSAALAVVSLAVASPATAAKYYSSDNPLVAWEDGVAQGQMYGRFFKEELSYLRNNTHLRDPRPGGDSVYEQTEYEWFHDYTFIPDTWLSGTTDKYTLTVDDDDWYSQYDHDPYDSGASLGRITTKVCERQSWSPDPCSATPTETFNF
jgi:hypothetical protein